MTQAAHFTLQGVIWDLDGTVLDTGEAHYLSWQETLAGYGIAISHEAFSKDFGGNNLRSLTKWFGAVTSAAQLTEIADKKEKLYRALIHTHTRLFPGVLSWLDYFKNNQIPQALASSAPMENITVSLETYALGLYFQKVISGEKMPSKPNPAIFLEAARQMCIQPDKCLVLEDSKPGLLGAHQAGMQVICKLGTLKRAPEYALAAFEDYPRNPAYYLADLLL